MFKLFMLFSLLSFSAFAQDQVGFSKGNKLTAHEVRGSFTLQCPSRQAYANCSGSYLAPVEADYFVHPESIDADEVELTRVTSRGKTIKKDSSFDAGMMRSKKRFNLWIATLTQRPLLTYGINTINYKLSNNGTIVKQGTFEVTVDEAPVKTCRHDFIWASSDSDCNIPSTYCNQYFNRCL